MVNGNQNSERPQHRRTMPAGSCDDSGTSRMRFNRYKTYSWPTSNQHRGHICAENVSRGIVAMTNDAGLSGLFSITSQCSLVDTKYY